MHNMKYYYHEKDGEQLGPCSKEELKLYRINKNTLVWTEGMDEWAKAKTLSELNDILISLPPELPKNHSITKKPNRKYINIESTFAGALLLIVGFGSLTLRPDINLGLISILFFSLRIFSITWVVQIAERLNRNKLLWGLFAFVLPSIALIVIGLVKEVRNNQIG